MRKKLLRFKLKNAILKIIQINGGFSPFIALPIQGTVEDFYMTQLKEKHFLELGISNSTI